MRLVETQGVGRIWLGRQLVVDPATYVIRYASKDATERSRRIREPETLPLQIEGRLTGMVPTTLVKVPVTLELEDGRRWRCRIESADGTLSDRGGISPIRR